MAAGSAESAESAESVRRVLAAWELGDTATFMAGLDPEVELVTDPHWPEPGSVRGDEQVRRWLEDYRETFSERRAAVQQTVEAGDRVVMQFVDTVTGRESGVSVENRFSALFTVRDGKIARIEYFVDHEDALVAIRRDA